MFFEGLQNACTLIKNRENGSHRRRRNNGLQAQNMGWENNNNNQGGWGGQQQGGNQGWGNQPSNQGWGNQQPNNQGWGHQQPSNQGWGNQKTQNSGWGQQQSNDGWGGNQGGQGSSQYGYQGAMIFNPNAQVHGNHLNGIAWVTEQQNKQSQVKHNVNMLQIAKFVEKQVVFIQPSPAKAKLEQLKKTGQTFKDDLFPPNVNSLSGEWGNVAEWKAITWNRISEKIPGAKIFSGKIQPGDIKQGYLGDCYFLAALAAIAQRPDRIFKLFLISQQNQQKYYSVKMLYKGKWMTIDMDQFVPFLYGEPAFTKANQKQLWVILLEKAWAKMFSNYKRIEAGFTEQGLHDLTGAPVRQIYLQQAGFNKNKQWAYLLQASKYEYSMCASSQPGSDTTKSVSGVVQGHAYTFLNAIQLNIQGQKQKLVQIRNPWGKGQAKGKWSDGDQNWNYVSQADKKSIGYNPNKDDGIFFMSWDDFCVQFRAITVAQIDDNSSYIYKSVKDPQCKGCFFKVKILKEGNYSFHIDKTPQRSYEDKVQTQFNYPIAEFQIGRVNEKKFDSSNSGKRTLYHDIDLKAGQYVVFARIRYDSKFQKDFDVNLAIYAQFPCEITLASRQEAVALSGNSAVQWTGQEQESKGSWNNLSGYNQGGNQGGNNSGWGNEGNQGGNNSGWGNQGNQGNQGNNSGWGNEGNKGNQGGNNGWGNQGGNTNNNSGWGNQQGGSNNGWGNQGGNSSNNGWGNQQGGSNNNGWGNQGNSNNNGW